MTAEETLLSKSGDDDDKTVYFNDDVSQIKEQKLQRVDDDDSVQHLELSVIEDPNVKAQMSLADNINMLQQID